MELDDLGAQFGTYMWNSITGEFFPSPMLDRNSYRGPSDVGHATAVVSGDTLTFTAEAG